MWKREQILQKGGMEWLSVSRMIFEPEAFPYSSMTKFAAQLVSRSHSLGMLPAIAFLLTLSLFAVAACSGGDDVAPPTPVPQPTVPSAPAAQPAAPTPVPEPTAAPVPTSPPAMAEPTQVSESAASGVMVTISDGSVARYSVTEQLASLSSPIDAVGETGDVEGAIVFESDGGIDPSRSVITVALAGLTSDESRRDRYVSNRVFDTSQYPNAELAITGVDGLDWPFPDSGETTFRLHGDMTVRDATSPTTWDVEAQSAGGVVTGQAKTVVTFDQFDLSKPSLAFIISVEDEIRLELDIQATIERE